MAFSKRTVSLYDRRTADPLLDFTEPYIQNGVISGQFYTAAQVSSGIPKPSYLQISANTNQITVVGDVYQPLRLIFPQGLHTASTGGPVGGWRTFTAKQTANTTVIPASNVNSWIYASLNKNSSTNPNNWTVEYYTTASTGRSLYWQLDQPYANSAPTGVDGDAWFDIANNVQKVYSTGTGTWQTLDRIYLGEIGIGDSGYAYSIQSWYPNYGYAAFDDSKYSLGQNPWRAFDGVSFITNGQYTATEAANWANNSVVYTAVNTSNIALQAVANNNQAIRVIANSANALILFANSAPAMNAFAANATCMSILANSSPTAQTILFQSNTAMNAIARSVVALQAIANSSQTILLYKLVDNANTYTIINNDATLYGAFANATAGPIFASGGNTTSVIVDGGIRYRVHQFTGSGTLTVRGTGRGGAQANVQYVVVAGGGGTSVGTNNSGGGGGGAGGYRTNVPGQLSGGTPGTAEAALPVTKQSYSVTVGGGGAGSTFIVPNVGVLGDNGTSSIFSTITSVGGGAGACSTSPGVGAARGGGSGGGGGAAGPGPNRFGAAGTPGQGHSGGTVSGDANPVGAGGGGAGGAGQAETTPFPGSSPAAGGIVGRGGVGRTSPITGTSVGYGGGGDGGTQGHSGFVVHTTAGGGTPFGGGYGTGPQTYVPVGSSSGPNLDAALRNGSPGTGGGGGGANGAGGTSANGGSGSVIIRYAIERI